jgi:hypothetical protein
MQYTNPRPENERDERNELDRELDEMLASSDEGPSTASEPAQSIQIVLPPAGAIPIPALTYGFPCGASKSLATTSTGDLVAKLDGLCRERAAGSLRSYHGGFRAAICEINIALNERCAIAPAFRPARKSPPYKKGTVVPAWVSDLSRDRLITDLHWLHSTGNRRLLHDETYRDLMLADEFDFKQAERFAMENWSSQIRANKILALTTYDQCQLGVLMTKEERQRTRALKLERIRVGAKLRAVAQRRTCHLQLAHAEDLANLWLAEALSAGGSQHQIAQVLSWLTRREPLTRATISQKLKTMGRWLDAAAS